ncbi:MULTISPECIES: TetR/AcrR family transcriptional regulator [Rhodopseudomonas]|uniref:TetR family transcriptional regulator n=1 Tax=Rhodopseudomonas palustris TaxID=1076 RepID=A0A0D7EP03_RHOPL|nr:MULTISPECIES: TetR/AcrR family transcriptional regulator [Rhodopseudomonas]KIZ42564.1 TetR family transcriptional regulator [Rhodopseudomonas palustris]MDF3811422.1 TetR/AcrR family transcriptional regulator [Rhodopseudomonas sp. BAL398]WOK16281.1 TetR/AcrR family transcriptional regulator [Rhodopseudomonas sp. BAL398]
MALRCGIRSQRKAERPAEILEAAFEEFAKNGYVATRIEDVAARVGVTKGTIYFYFGTKERVFTEMVRFKSQALFPDLEKHAATLTGSYAERLNAMMIFMYQRISQDRSSREVLRFLICDGFRFPDLVDKHYDEFIHPMLQRVRDLIDGGIAAGEFRASPATLSAEILISPSLLLSVWSLMFGTRRAIDIECFTKASMDMLMNGIARTD